MLKRSELGHWTFGRAVDPDKHFGFVYCITNLKEGRFYIGRKNFATGGRKTKKNAAGKRVKNSRYGRDTKWREYTSSSEHLIADIEKLGKEHFKFEIIDVYDTYGELYYAEAYCQMCTHSMTLRMENNEDCFLFYNRQIAPVRFRPKAGPTKKTISFINTLNRKVKNNGKD